MAAHSIICPVSMYIRSAAKRDNQHRLLYFLWIPGSSGKTFLLNAPTSSRDSWVGLLVSCLLVVKLFEMKVNSPCFNSLSKQLTNKVRGGRSRAKMCLDNKRAAELSLNSTGCSFCQFHCLCVFDDFFLFLCLSLGYSDFWFFPHKPIYSVLV